MTVPTAPVNIKQTEVGFGLVAYKDEAEFVVVDGDVSPASQIVGNIAYEAPTGKDLDELEMDSINLKFAPGVGELKIFVKGLDGSLEGNFKVNYLVG